MKTQASLGWLGPDAEEILVTNRTGSAVAIGDVEMLDIFRDDAASTTNQFGVAASGTANIVVPLAKARQMGIYGVVQKVAADDAVTNLRLRGYCPVVAISAAAVLTTPTVYRGGTTENAVLNVPVTAGDATAGQGIPAKVIFIPLTAGTGTTDGWFDGINGFGTVLSTT